MGPHPKTSMLKAWQKQQKNSWQNIKKMGLG
jgi:hypothetical protein